MAQTNKIRTGQIDGALKSKIITATRDMTAATGDVIYTGVGFIPTAIIAMGAINTTMNISIGISDSSMNSNQINQIFTGNTYEDLTSKLLVFATAAGATQSAIVKSFDADGFTLTWTKANSPTGTANLKFICFR